MTTRASVPLRSIATSSRNPSHFGSIIQPLCAGHVCARVLSIGSGIAMDQAYAGHRCSAPTRSWAHARISHERHATEHGLVGCADAEETTNAVGSRGPIPVAVV